MFASGGFWDISPSSFLKILKLPSLYLGNFKIFKNALEQFIPNHPPKHVITSTNYSAIIRLHKASLNYEIVNYELEQYKQN